MLDIKNRKILTLFLSLSNCFFCHSTGSAPQTLSSHCQLPGLFHPGRVGNQSPEAEMKEGLTQGSWVEPLGLFLYTEKAKKCRTCSSVTSFCKEGTRTRRMMCRSHSSVHPCNTKTQQNPVGSLKSKVRDCSVHLFSPRIYRDCAVSFLERKFAQIHVVFLFCRTN